MRLAHIGFPEEIAAGPMQCEILKRGGKLKITKNQLRRIIREEKAGLQEVEYHGDPLDDIMKEAMSILRSMDRMERSARIYEIIDHLEDLVTRE